MEGSKSRGMGRHATQRAHRIQHCSAVTTSACCQQQSTAVATAVQGHAGTSCRGLGSRQPHSRDHCKVPEPALLGGVVDNNRGRLASPVRSGSSTNDCKRQTMALRCAAAQGRPRKGRCWGRGRRLGADVARTLHQQDAAVPVLAVQVADNPVCVIIVVHLHKPKAT